MSDKSCQYVSWLAYPLVTFTVVMLYFYLHGVFEPLWISANIPVIVGAVMVTVLKSLDYPFAAIEEPLVANDYAGVSIIADALGLPLILDESFLRAEQFPRIAVQGNGLWMITRGSA